MHDVIVPEPPQAVMPVSSVAALRSAIGDMTRQIADAVVLCGERLTPVLRDPVPSTESVKAEPAPPTCELVAGLQAHHEALGVILARLQSIDERLEL